MPYNLTMLIRGLTHMEGVLADLAPDINIMEIARAKILENLRSPSHIENEMKKSGKRIFLSLHKAQDIPSDLAGALKEFRNGEARMKLDIHASGQLSQLLYRLLFCFVEGLMIMALLISSSIVCTTDMQPRFLGMPIVAVIGYGLAVLLALHMIVSYYRRGKEEA